MSKENDFWARFDEEFKRQEAVDEGTLGELESPDFKKMRMDRERRAAEEIRENVADQKIPEIDPNFWGVYEKGEEVHFPDEQEAAE